MAPLSALLSLLGAGAAAAARPSAAHHARLGAGSYPLPPYPPTWALNASTIIMPCNYSGPTDPRSTVGWQYIDFDWSNWKGRGDADGWAKHKPMDCEELLVKQVDMTTSASPGTTVWVYRNFIKALPWFTSVRVKLEDPAYASWFLNFNCSASDPLSGCHVPVCDTNYDPPLCSKYYHDQEQTPGFPHGDGDCAPPACDVGGIPVGEYLFNFMNANVSVNGQTLIEWYLSDYFFSQSGGGNPLISGFELDDLWTTQDGPTEMEAHVVADLGMSPSDVEAMVDAFNWARDLAYAEIFKRGRFDWTSFFTINSEWPACSGPFVSNATCASDLRSLCDASSPVQHSAMLYGWSPGACDWSPPGPNHYDPGHLLIPETDIAAFQLIRGAYGFLGSGWEGCSLSYERPALLDRDFGVPSGLCSETAPGSGVFERDFSTVTVSLDCATFEPTFRWK